MYECQVNTSPHLAHRVQLSVITPQCEVLGESRVYLNVGSQHTINCTVLSPQAPHHIFWYFNHQPLPRHEAWQVTSVMEAGHSWSSVRLQTVSLEQSGTYECRPSNCQPDTITMTVLDGKECRVLGTFYVLDREKSLFFLANRPFTFYSESNNFFLNLLFL